MRVSTLFTVASLFLIGSYSLPQPENLEARRTIEEREARIPEGVVHGEGENWHQHHDKDGSWAPPSNSTKIKEREAHHEWPSDMPGDNFPNFFDHKHGSPGTPPPSSTNSTTKIKARQAPEHFGPPPDGVSWEEFKKHLKHMNHEGAANSTKVRVRKFSE